MKNDPERRAVRPPTPKSAHDGTSADRPSGEPHGPVVVVGPCASGKTTLVRELTRLGYDAKAIGQEHSEITTLWKRTRPSLVIALHADLATIRRRRDATWPETVYDSQRRRLRDATAAAAVVLDTAELSPMAVLAAATGALREAGITPARAPDFRSS